MYEVSHCALHYQYMIYIYNMSYHIVFVAFRKKWETARSGGELFGRVQKLLNSVDLWSILHICDHLWSILMWSCNWIRIIRLHLLQSVYLKIFEEMQWPSNFREVAKKGIRGISFKVLSLGCSMFEESFILLSPRLKRFTEQAAADAVAWQRGLSPFKRSLHEANRQGSTDAVGGELHPWWLGEAVTWVGHWPFCQVTSKVVRFLLWQVSVWYIVILSLVLRFLRRLDQKVGRPTNLLMKIHTESNIY